jgi:LysM repeat protein
LYDRHAMAARSRARYLVPIVLVAVIAGTYLIIHGTLTSKSKTAQHHRHHRGPKGKFARRRFYVVKGGDSLTGIATKTGVALNQLESLNPGLDPNSLQMGQRIRLRR